MVRSALKLLPPYRWTNSHFLTSKRLVPFLDAPKPPFFVLSLLPPLRPFPSKPSGLPGALSWIVAEGRVEHPVNFPVKWCNFSKSSFVQIPWLTFGWRFPTHWIQHLSGVRLMLDFNFSIAIDQSIPWMWLSISMGEAVGLLSEWNWYWRWSMHWVRPEFGKIRFDVCWLEWQTYTVDPISINVSWFILSEILWTCWQNLIW